MLLIDAIWQQFAREAAGIITCARCPAPDCGRWRACLQPVLPVVAELVAAHSVQVRCWPWSRWARAYDASLKRIAHTLVNEPRTYRLAWRKGAIDAGASSLWVAQRYFRPTGEGELIEPAACTSASSATSSPRSPAIISDMYTRGDHAARYHQWAVALHEAAHAAVAASLGIRLEEVSILPGPGTVGHCRYRSDATGVAPRSDTSQALCMLWLSQGCTE